MQFSFVILEYHVVILINSLFDLCCLFLRTDSAVWR